MKTETCVVCGEKYLAHAMKQHHSQMAGKEAQYLMADIFYFGEEVETITRAKVLAKCPHWKYIFEHPEIQHRPVSKRTNTPTT